MEKAIDSYVSYIYIWIVSAVCLLYYFVKHRNNLPLPPGPKSLPFIGNAFDLPLSHEYLTYARWGKEYGDVVHVTALGKHIIILNSTKACVDLLDQRSKVYSDRPTLPMINEPELMDGGWSFTNMRYSKQWKRHRRLFTQYINPTSITQTFAEKQVSSVHMLLRWLLSEPNSFRKHLKYTSTNLLLGIAYGYTVKSGHDELAELAEEAMALATDGFQPKYLVNVFPILRHVPAWLPGAGFKRFARQCRTILYRLRTEPFDETIKKIAQGKTSASFIQQAFEDVTEGHDPTRTEDIKGIAATMYAAGSDTTYAVMHTLILRLILHPDIQRKVHDELDGVVGSPESPKFCLPTWDDRPRTPYLEAVIKELLRCHPPVGSGVPHGTVEEDEYRGWRIPKGSIVFANAWGILHSEEDYKDPEVFRPERFLGKNPEPDPNGNGVFGFGRRACPGRLLAENMIWLESACLLATFTFSPAKGEDGKEINIQYATKPMAGFIQHTPDFPCSITPRSQKAEKIIRETESLEH